MSKAGIVDCSAINVLILILKKKKRNSCSYLLGCRCCSSKGIEELYGWELRGEATHLSLSLFTCVILCVLQIHLCSLQCYIQHIVTAGAKSSDICFEFSKSLWSKAYTGSKMCDCYTSELLMFEAFWIEKDHICLRYNLLCSSQSHEVKECLSIFICLAWACHVNWVHTCGYTVQSCSTIKAWEVHFT